MSAIPLLSGGLGDIRQMRRKCRPSRQRRFYCSQCRLKWTKCLP